MGSLSLPNKMVLQSIRVVRCCVETNSLQRDTKSIFSTHAYIYALETLTISNYRLHIQKHKQRLWAFCMFFARSYPVWDSVFNGEFDFELQGTLWNASCNILQWHPQDWGSDAQHSALTPKPLRLQLVLQAPRCSHGKSKEFWEIPGAQPTNIQLLQKLLWRDGGSKLCVEKGLV